MRTFKTTPFLEVLFNPPIGKEHITNVQFDENGEFTTDNELLIDKFFHEYDSFPTNGEQIEGELPKPAHACKKCDFVAETNSNLLAHYKTTHPKEKS